MGKKIGKFLTNSMIILLGIIILCIIAILLYSQLNADVKDDFNHSTVEETEEVILPTIVEEDEMEPILESESSDGGEQDTLHNHKYQSSIKREATCSQSGVYEYACSCGEHYEENVGALGHEMGDWKTENSMDVIRCLVCNEILYTRTVDESHRHYYHWVITKQPTCMALGVKEYKCECGSYYKESLALKAHEPSEWTITKAATKYETGTEMKYCTVCGSILQNRTVPKVVSGNNVPK